LELNEASEPDKTGLYWSIRNYL